MHKLSITAIAAAALLAAGASHATDRNASTDGSWNSFDVESVIAASGGVEWIDLADGSALRYLFTVPSGFSAMLTVVDGGFGGDTFSVYSGSDLLGVTSPVPLTDFDSAPSIGTAFDAALNNPAFSSASFALGPGSYAIRGLLVQSVQFAGADLNATIGAISVTLVPEPGTVAMLMAGVALVGAAARKRG